MPWLSQPTLRAQGQNPAPSDRIRVGVIGLGSRGFNLIDDLLNLPDVEIPVVCDVDRRHYRDRPWGSNGPVYGRDPAQSHIDAKSGRRPEAVTDFRDVCQRDDLDAVIVATPDHWHALCTLTALRHGKAVYCEKPVTHTFQEGLAVCAEVERRKAVFQVGSQQRSEAVFRRAVELYAMGCWGSCRRSRSAWPQAMSNLRIRPTSKRHPAIWIMTGGADQPRFYPTCGQGIIDGGAATGLSAVAC